MKVLFAMGSNQWSKNIADRYYDKFGETIEYKDVFYFKALLEEVKRNKTYNVIVIHEDLEQYKTKDIEQLDRKLFSYVDSITDEAQDADIIYICSDRRTKDDQFIVRLYSIGIYNILLGDDRNVNPLCEIIKKPKTKREAKAYLNIDSTSINETGIMRDDEVDEMQMVSILNYYSKIKEQPEKYVETFDRISTQYSRAQLKVIASWLPKDVQEVIYNEPKYKYLLLSDGGEQQKSPQSNKIAPDVKKIERAHSQDFFGVFKRSKDKFMKNLNSKLDKNNTTGSNQSTNNSEFDNKRQQELAEKTKREAQLREQQELAERAKKEAQLREQQELAERAKREAEERERQEQKAQVEDIIIENNLNLNQELNNALKAEAEEKALKEQEERERKEAEIKQQEELTARLKEEAARRAREEQEERERKEAQIAKEQEELAVRLKEEAARRAKEEQEERLKNEANNQSVINASVVSATMSAEQKRFKEEQEKLAIEQEKIRKVQAELEEEKRKLREEQERLAKEKNQLEVTPAYEQPRTTYEVSTVTPVNYKKVVAFVGANKAGTSFMVNAVAQQLSNQKILTSILDMTRDKSMYYIYNQSDKTLRRIATECMQKLSNGEDTYMPISKFLKVYTTIPGGISDSRRSFKHKTIIETVKENSNVTIIDADFTTPIDYFQNASEIYIVQDMDILKIQETTMFLREMKNRNMDMSKIKVIINKYVKNMLTPKKIIEGLSYYKDPEMTFIDTLLNNKVPYLVVPYNLNNYIKYIESLYKGTMSFKGYSADFLESIEEISNIVYPKNGMGKKSKSGLFG